MNLYQILCVSMLITCAINLGLAIGESNWYAALAWGTTIMWVVGSLVKSHEEDKK